MGKQPDIEVGGNEIKSSLFLAGVAIFGLVSACFLCRVALLEGIRNFDVEGFADAIMEPPSEFCTLDDPVYRLIAENGQDWWQYFTSTHELILEFDFPGPTDDLVRSSLIKNTSSDLLYLWIAVRSLPRDIVGSAGYIYSPARLVQGPHDARHSLKHLEGNIYCYVFDDLG